MEYWNRKMETMPREQLDRLQLKRFKNIFTYAYERSPAYRALYQRHGVAPEDLKSLTDIRRVPLITKKFFSDSIEDSVYGSTLTCDPTEVMFYHQTSGTTSRPLPQPDTRDDWYYNGECWANALWAHGVRPGDKAMLAFNYNLFIGFWQAHYGCEKLNVEIVPGGGLSTEVKLEKIRDLGVTVLLTTPSYAFRMAEAAEEMGLDPRQTKVRCVITSGEPGGLVGGVKRKLEEMWNAEVFDNIGATEIGSWGFECTAHSGGLHINESCFLPEIIGLEDDEPITEPGKYGRLVLTNFFRRGRPCIRFNSNDIACWSAEPCPCGRTYRTLQGGIQGRTDHMLKVQGTFVNPVTVEDAVNRFEKCSQEYQITIHEDNKRITVTAESAPGIGEHEFPAVAGELARRIRSAAFVSMNVNIVPYGSMTRSESKSKRVIDLRDKEAIIWKAKQ